MTEPAVGRQFMILLVASTAPEQDGSARRSGGPATSPAVGPATALERAACSVFEAGHLPVSGELVTTLRTDPAEDGTGGVRVHPFLRRMLARCDAVLYVGDDRATAAAVADLARWEGKAVYAHPEELPPAWRSISGTPASRTSNDHRQCSDNNAQ